MNYQISSNVFSRTVVDEEVLLDPNSGNYFGMNDVGTAIWTQLQTGKSVDQIVAQLVTEFEVTPDLARADVTNYMQSLQQLGFLTVDAD